MFSVRKKNTVFVFVFVPTCAFPLFVGMGERSLAVLVSNPCV